MRRFELVEGTSSKFWEIAISGVVLTTRWGRIGAAGSSKQQKLASPAAAIAEHDKLVQEKTRKGYREVGAAGTAATKAASARRVAASASKPPGPAAASAKPARPAPAVDPKDLALTQQNAGGGRLGRVVIDGRFAIAVGDGCFATTDGKSFHRRQSPGRTFGLASIDGALYACGGSAVVSRDRGAKWKEIEVPSHGYRFCIYRDAAGTWWMGCDDGVVLTSKQPDRGWKKARFALKGKVLVIGEFAGKLIFAGTGGGGAWDGKQLRPLAGFSKKTDVITRITEAPSGALVAIGDGGIAYRSTDGGARWTPVKTSVKEDLEDCAWVAGALFVVGGREAWGGGSAVVLRSTNEGKTFTKVPTKIGSKLWGIASWGDGAFLCGDGGAVWRLASPKDPYWKGATDELAPPPPTIDEAFAPRPAAPAAERERTYERLLGEALKAAAAASAKLRAARAPDGNPELAQLVDEAPDADTSAAQVYADWLQAQGDPRGELAAIQLQREAEPKRKDLQRAEKSLLRRGAERWFGKLAPYGDLLQLRWRAGFLHTARIASTFERFDRDESGEESTSLPEVLGLLLDEPSARFLRELTVGIVTFEDNDYGGIARVLSQRYLPSLRSLFLGDFHSEETELNWSTIGIIEPMYAALPNLRALKLRSGDMDLGTIVLPRLERFEVITGGLDNTAARSIAAATWPSLRALSIQVGPARRTGKSSTKAKDFQPILDGVGLPRLLHLGLTNLDFTDALIEPLAHGKLLPQLAELDLKMGALSDDGARVFYRYQKAFAHLSHIDVDDNFLTRAGVQLLKSTQLPFHFGEQRDDEGDPENRYASAYE
ncbi:MAG TPA: WGR domain-containing protein [Kofleriaceae bacterium]|nr:WGR domain-containing protein [Kofleriaceae bacterium]